MENVTRQEVLFLQQQDHIRSGVFSLMDIKNKYNGSKKMNINYNNPIFQGRLLIIFTILIILLFTISCKNYKRCTKNKVHMFKEVTEKKYGDNNKMQLLIQKVLNKDPKATLIAKMTGSLANPDLQKLAKHDDEEVREIALLCLNETGGSEASIAFVDALLDEDPQVRAIALRGLHHNPDETVYQLLFQAYDKSKDPYVQQQILLIVGRMGSHVNLVDLKKRCQLEKSLEVNEGCIVALANLNDKEAQDKFIKCLHDSSYKIRARYLEYCEYINSSWLIKPLLPLLDDKSPMVYIGIDARPDMTEFLRACDITVNLIASISGHKFSFNVNRTTNYSETQLQDVKQYIRNLK